MDIHPDILSAVGGTPLVRLSRLHPPGNLLAKVEFVNPGGSVKDRIAASMIDEAEAAGLLRPGGTIVEATSGNTGAALAMLAAVRGYHLVAVMTDKMSKEKQGLLRAYGAEVVICPGAVAPDDLRSLFSTTARIAEERGAYRPDQESNPANPAGHYHSTGPEIWRQTDGQVGALVAGVGTGGTITGTARFLKERNPGVWVVGADPEGSIFTAGSPADVHPWLTEGVGEELWPDVFDPSVVDEYEVVGDEEAFRTARRLAAVEGILAGGSSGLAVAAALRVAARRPGDLLVVILPDTGRNYLSKVFDDGWMTEHGFREES
jgi:cystathionine beta-synthase